MARRPVTTDNYKFSSVPNGYVGIGKHGIGIVEIIPAHEHLELRVPATFEGEADESYKQKLWKAKKEIYAEHYRWLCRYCQGKFRSSWNLAIHMRFCKENPLRIPKTPFNVRFVVYKHKELKDKGYTYEQIMDTDIREELERALKEQKEQQSENEALSGEIIQE